MKKLSIAILGTRGIPNHYGGYEQAITFLAPALVAKGHSVTVYNSHNHPNKEMHWQGVDRIRCYDPESLLGTAGQFIYDLNCILHARKKKYDVLLFMGYTSSSIWGRWFPRNIPVISNMDGLEWKRNKYSRPTQQFLRYAEKLAIRYSDFCIADSPAIQDYLLEKYNVPSEFIPYGAIIPGMDRHSCNERYHLLIARMEPENNIEMILEGHQLSQVSDRLIVVGNTNTSYGRKLQSRYKNISNIQFTGSIFDQQHLSILRAGCTLYFHGHSVGGTNPSLLEAMASGAPITAHDNPFNRAVLGDNAFYFSTAIDVCRIIQQSTSHEVWVMQEANLEKIRTQYTWDIITRQYEAYILHCIKSFI